MFSRFPPDSNDTKDTRVSAGSRRTTYRDQENVCSRQNCQPRITFDAPKPDARTTFKKDGEKHGQREILESRDIRQVPNKRRVEVQSQNRDLLIRDVCTCLALRGFSGLPRAASVSKIRGDAVAIIWDYFGPLAPAHLDIHFKRKGSPLYLALYQR